MTAVTVRVPAKVNVQLAVGGRRADGFHDLANVFLAVGLYDHVTATPADRLTITAEGRDTASVPLDESNLAARAALGVGRGELLTPLEVAGTFHWVFAVADGGLSTPEVYRECDRLRREAGHGDGVADVPAPAADPALLAALAAGDAPALAAALTNDLQPAALALRPALADTLETGLGSGALAGIVSGSGPTVAFLVADADAAAKTASALGPSARVATAPAAGAAVLP